MGERIKAWRANDGEEFATRAEMEAHEGLIALSAWFGDLLIDGADSDALAKAAVEDGQTLIGLLRACGVKTRVEKGPRKRRLNRYTSGQAAAEADAALGRAAE